MCNCSSPSQLHMSHPLPAGVAVSTDGINWLRGQGTVEGHRSAAEQYGDVGVVLSPNSDNWWTCDTAHLSVADVQVCVDT